MPSKTQRAGLESLLAPLRRPFRSAVVAAREELRAIATPSQKSADASTTDPFASSYLDPNKLAEITPQQDHGTADIPRLEAALKVLEQLLDQGDALFTLEVPRGGDLYALVNARLAEIGRAFAAARSASLAQAGLPGLDRESAHLAAWPFANWSSAERALAPSLLIKVHGEDLAAENLAAFADGNLVMGFEVEGPASPAPLIGLVRPGTFVAEVSEPPTELPDSGPAFVALFPSAPTTTALFIHTPAAASLSGEGIFTRLEITRLPEAGPTGQLGIKSLRQMQEELRQLAALVIEPRAEVPGTPADEATLAATKATSASSDPIDRLAAWLLQRIEE